MKNWSILYPNSNNEMFTSSTCVHMHILVVYMYECVQIMGCFEYFTSIMLWILSTYIPTTNWQMYSYVQLNICYPHRCGVLQWGRLKQKEQKPTKQRTQFNVRVLRPLCSNMGRTQNRFNSTQFFTYSVN